MKLKNDILKSLLSNNESALDFYLTYAPNGLFYFKEDNVSDIWADSKLSYILEEDEATQSCRVNSFLEEKSIRLLEQWITEESNQEEVRKLHCQVKENRYEILCRKFIDSDEKIVLIGVDTFSKIGGTYGEEYFNYIVENATEGITVYENEILVYASPSYLTMMGDAFEEIKGNGADWAFGIIHPDDRPGIVSIFEEIYDQKISQKRYRFRAKKKDGEYIWREDHASFVFKEQGGIERAVVVAKDITHQIEMEKELVKQEEIYRKLFNNIQIGLLLTDAETNIIGANEVAASLIGYPAEVLMQTKVKDPSWELYNESHEVVPYNKFPVSITADTGKHVPPTKLGFIQYDGSGREVWLDITSSPILDEKGEIDKIVCTFIDVTEKHDAQRKILKTNEELTLFKQFIDSSTDALQVADKSGNLVYVNNVATESLAIKKEEISNYRVIDFETFLKTQEDWDKHFNELREKGKMTVEGEHSNMSTGRKFPVEVTENYAKLNNKEYVIASIRDITERKRAEREIISQARFPKENPNPILRVNAKGKLLYLNDAANNQLKHWKMELHQPVTLEIRALVKEVFAKNESLQSEAMIRGAYYSISISYIEDHKYANVYLLDITNQREAENQLQLEKRRLDNIINGVKLGTWEWNMVENYLDFNTHWAEMLGYTIEEVTPGSYELWKDKVHPDDLHKAEEAIQAHINNETENYVTEFRMKHKEGHWVWIVSRGKIISRDTANNPTLFSGTHNDITERKKQEEELRLFESIIKKANDSVLITEAKINKGDGLKIIFANSAFCKMTGYSQKELIGETTNILRGPLTDLNTIDKIEKSIQSLKPFEFELINYKKNGESFWLNLSATPLVNEKGEYTHWITIQRDITQQKEQEEELRLFESIIKNTKDAVLISEIQNNNPADSIIVFANEALCEMTGYTTKELYGKSPEVLRGPLTNEDTLKKISKATINVEAFEFELINYKKDGEPFWISLSVTPLTNIQGKHTHWITIQRDITKQKVQDQKLLEAKEKAEAASIAKSDFLANMSHEIRTPLNSVIGFSELLMQTQLSSSQLEYMQSVNYSAHSLLDLINDILDFSKIEAGKLELNIEKTDLHELLYQVIEMVKFKVNSLDIELILYIDNKVPQYVWVDAVRLRQILVNLLSNASKFTEKGEIELSVELEKTYEKDSKVKLQLGVRDTGIGISETKQKTIFDAFSQEDASTTRKYGGTGLGLSITNKLLDLMGSSMQLQSQQGKGSFFYFSVDLKVEKTDKSLFDVSNYLIPSISKVLVVDDNSRTLWIIQEMLNAMGLKVQVSSNGIEALTIIKNLGEELDAVIIDCEMPFMDGIEIVKQIRGQLKLTEEELPIILLNSLANDDNYIHELRTYQISTLVHKPILFKELYNAVVNSKNPVNKETVENIDDSKPTQNLIGNSVLVVDDNPINRKLVLSMLDKLFVDLEVIEAESGKEAVKITQQQKPTLIFMDIQMPGMSGYEASQTIRKIQTETTEFESNPPVILALTAGTVKGERERCLAAGMDDYLSKPITMDKLEEAIQTWIGVKKQDVKPIVEVETSKSSVDFNYDELLRRFNNDKIVIEEMLDLFKRGDLKKQVIKLSELVKSKKLDNDEIKSTAHTIKGTSLNLCFEKLSDVATQIEIMRPNYKNIELQKLVESLLNDYNRLESIIFNKDYAGVEA